MEGGTTSYECALLRHILGYVFDFVHYDICVRLCLKFLTQTNWREPHCARRSENY